MAVEKNKSKTRKPRSIKDIKLDYLTGSPVDSKTLRGAAGFFGSMLLMTFAFLLLGIALVMDNAVLRVVFNSMILLGTMMLFFQNGAVRGTTDVNHGEMMAERRKNGHTVEKKDLDACYQPAKGFIIALLGCLPMVICGVLLALVATKQMTGLGALPSWVSAFEDRTEIGNALLFYHQDVAMTMEDVLRVFLRMAMMPLVNMVSPYGADALLTLERCSALVMLVPALCYGLGYLQGVRQRKLVHLGIAEGEKKRRKKERRQNRARQQQRAPKGPQQLN